MSSKVLLGSAIGLAFGLLVSRLFIRRILKAAAGPGGVASERTPRGVLRFGASVWWIGIVAGIGLPIACGALAISERSTRPIDVYSCIGMAVVSAAIGWYLVLESQFCHVAFDDVAVTAVSLLSSRRTVRWDAIRTVKFARTLGYIVLDNGHDPPVRVTAALAGFGSFVEALREHLGGRLLEQPRTDLASYHARFGIR